MAGKGWNRVDEEPENASAWAIWSVISKHQPNNDMAPRALGEIIVFLALLTGKASAGKFILAQIVPVYHPGNQQNQLRKAAKPLHIPAHR